MKKDYEAVIIANMVEQFKTLRLKKGLSHNKLSIKAGITRPAISQIESGKRRPTFVVCLKIAHALDKKLSDIIAKCERDIRGKKS